jgi:15-cis-phytoene synthase
MTRAADPTDAATAVLVRQSARSGEPDFWLAALSAPAAARDGLIAIAAFAAEIARIAEHARQPLVGEIRLQWWRDTLAAAGQGVRSGHPIADAMADAVRRHALPMTAIERCLEAHSFDVSGALLTDDAALEDYLAATRGLLFALGVAALAGPDAAAHPGLRDAGIAYGLARGLGRLALTRRVGAFVIPKSRLDAAGIDPAVLQQTPPPRDAVAAIETIARDLEVEARGARDRARSSLADLLPAARPALLPLAMVEPYFAAQNRRGVRRLEDIADPMPLARVWRLWRAHRSGRI